MEGVEGDTLPLALCRREAYRLARPEVEVMECLIISVTDKESGCLQTEKSALARDRDAAMADAAGARNGLRTGVQGRQAAARAAEHWAARIPSCTRCHHRNVFAGYGGADTYRGVAFDAKLLKAAHVEKLVGVFLARPWAHSACSGSASGEDLVRIWTHRRQRISFIH